MANTENLKLIISGDGKSLGTELNKTEARIKGWGGRVGSVFGGLGKKITGSLGKIVTNPLSIVGGSAGILYAGKKLVDYQDKLSSLGLMVGKTDSEIVKMDDDITRLAYSTGQDRDGIVDALADMADKTGDFEFSLKAMESAARSSTAMSADLMDVTRVVSSLRLGMGATAEEIEEYLDVMARMGNVGSFVFRDQAAQAERLFSSSAMAIKLTKRSFAEYNAFMQMIKPSFGSADMAGTAIDSIINRFRSEQKDIEKAVRFKIFDEKGAIIDFAKTIKAIGKLKPKVQKELFGEYQRAFTIFGFAGAEAQYDAMIKAGQEAGFVTEAFTKKSREAKFQINALVTAVKDFASAGLSPVLESLTKKLSDLTSDPQRMEAFRNEIKEVGNTIGQGAVKINEMVGALEGFLMISKALAWMIKAPGDVKDWFDTNKDWGEWEIEQKARKTGDYPWWHRNAKWRQRSRATTQKQEESMALLEGVRVPKSVKDAVVSQTQIQQYKMVDGVRVPMNLDQKITIVAPEGTRVLTENRGSNISANTKTSVNRGAF